MHYRISAIMVCLTYSLTSCQTTDPGSECWRSVQTEAPETSPLLSTDYKNMAQFSVDFIQVLKLHEVFLCLDEDLTDQSIKYIFVSTMARAGIFFMDCHLTPSARASRLGHLSSQRSEDKGRKKFTSAVLRVTSRRGVANALAGYQTRGVLNEGLISYIFVGSNLPGCKTRNDGSGHWFYARFNESALSGQIEEVYAFGDNLDDLAMAVATWRMNPSAPGLTLLREPGVGPSDFEGHVLKAFTVPYEPFVIVSHSCKDPQDSPCSLNVDDARHDGRIDKKKVQGYLVEILEILSKRLNFRVDLRLLPSDEATFGIDEGGGNFSGLVGYLQRKKADVALSALQMTKERATAMDFTGSIAFSSYSLYIRSNATKQIIGWKTYVRSFQWTAWLAILLLLFVASVCFWMSVMPLQDEDPHFKKGANVTFILFSCIVQQGSWILPRTLRTQGILWLFWVASVILYASYTARLTSYLTVSSTQFPFASLSGAVSAPGWRIILQRGTSILNYIKLQRPDNGVYGAIHRSIMDDPSLIVNDNYEGLHRILTEDYLVLLSEDVAMRYLVSNCSVLQIPGSYLSGYLHVGLRKHLPFSGIINNELNKMSGGGILDRISKQWWTQSIPCFGSSAYTELGFTNILTAFLLLVAGFGMSLLFLLIEFRQKNRSFLYSLSDGPPVPVKTELRPYSKSGKS